MERKSNFHFLNFDFDLVGYRQSYHFNNFYIFLSHNYDIIINLRVS